MGQSQSSDHPPNNDAQGDKESDLYKLLGIEPDATADDIKKAYRRKALELHPDRNYGDVDRTTALFAEVQSAYEVLSDPQERSWYDSHRDAILFNANNRNDGGKGNQFFHNSRVTTTEDIIGYFVKFGSHIQFSDSPTGFFGGLREIFDQLAREEALACKWDGLGQPIDYPSFGSKDDEHNTIREFYSAWDSFATRKSFSWKDVYRYSEAPDRRVRRLMEKENKRLRDEATREFNDAVRSLVAFAKKRDPRYKSTAQSEAERQKLLREAAAAQAARSRAANEAKMRNFELPDWAQAGNPDEDEAEATTETEEESEQESFKCEICRKYFKSEKQFEAHERSKKHVKAVKQVQREMRNDEKQFQLNSATQSSREPTPLIDDAEDRELSADDGPLIEPEDIDRSELKEDSTQPANLDENPSPGTVPDETDLTGDLEPKVSDSHPNPSDNQDSVDEITKPLSEATVADILPPPKIGKAKQKRAKKAAQGTAEGESAGMTCSSCHASFSSRTKLFNHIKDLGHAQPVGKGKKSNKKGSKS